VVVVRVLIDINEKIGRITKGLDLLKRKVEILRRQLISLRPLYAKVRRRPAPLCACMLLNAACTLDRLDQSCSNGPCATPTSPTAKRSSTPATSSKFAVDCWRRRSVAEPCVWVGVVRL
jgi:hypothetical protein